MKLGGLGGGGDQLSILGANHGLKLLGYGLLREVVVMLIGNEHIHGRGLGRDDLGVHRLATQINLAAVGFLDGHRGHTAEHLHLRAFRVYKLNSGQYIIKQETHSLTRVDQNRVDLALDRDRALFALIDVDRVLQIGLVDEQIVATLLEFHFPFLVHKLEYRRFLGDLGRVGNFGRGQTCRASVRRSGHYGSCSQIRIFVGLLVVAHFFQVASDGTAFVYLGEQSIRAGACGTGARLS